MTLRGMHFHQTTTLRPEQYIDGLTDFGLGRSKLFGNSADEYLGCIGSVGQMQTLQKARAAFGSARTMTAPIPTMLSSRRRTQISGVARPATRIPLRGIPTGRQRSTLSSCVKAKT